MVAIDEFYKYLQSRAQEVQIEGEYVTSTVFAVHVTDRKSEQLMAEIKGSFGARIFDYVPPVEWPDDQPDTRDANDPSRLAAFRCYVPPTSDDEIFTTTSELMERFEQALNRMLEMDPNAIRRLMSQNFQCSVAFAEGHEHVRCNAVMDREQGATPTITPWALLTGLLEEVLGERMNLKTEDDDQIQPGKIIPIERFIRGKH